MELEHSTVWILLSFILGYVLIIFEHLTHVNKTTIALLTAVACWAFQFSSPALTVEQHHDMLCHHLGHVSEVVIFLLGALAIVEIINAHNGFALITRNLRMDSKVRMLWILSSLAFIFSSVLDNLTTAVVMISILYRLVSHQQDRLLLGSAVVIAANAGGAWTPIGDVTTTMLWIGGFISPLSVMTALFIPSIVCMVVAIAYLQRHLVHSEQGIDIPAATVKKQTIVEPAGEWMFALGLGSLIFVPIFKVLTGLPPMMGILLGLGVLWVVADCLHHGDSGRSHLRVPAILSRIDLSAVLFFLGILLAVDALESAGILHTLADSIEYWMPSKSLIAFAIGLVSAVVDNVPLVAASMKMYDLTSMPPGSSFWHQIAYTAGTGGSILIIGSAAGVAFMGLERVNFFWYLRYAAPAALGGYITGFLTHLILLPWTG